MTADIALRPELVEEELRHEVVAEVVEVDPVDEDPVRRLDRGGDLRGDVDEGDAHLVTALAQLRRVLPADVRLGDVAVHVAESPELVELGEERLFLSRPDLSHPPGERLQDERELRSG